MTTSSSRSFDEVDVSSLAFWSNPWQERELSFAALRARDALSWHAPAEGGLAPPGTDPGFWAAVTHGDVTAVSRRSNVFCTGEGVSIDDTPREILEASASFLAMDAPRHTALRQLVSSAFTPKQIARIEAQIQNQAKRIVDELILTGDCDLAAVVSRRLPMWTISEMIGIEPDERANVADAANSFLAENDPIVQAGRDPMAVRMESMVTLHTAAARLAAARRDDPRDDLMTGLVQAEVDGQRLTDAEISSFFVLLSVAGNDTTQNTISHGVKAFCDSPDQRAMLQTDVAGRIGGAVEEIIRYSTPVMTFRRTATVDTELGGRTIAAGEKVVMFYTSANRDERVFKDPNRFDITRSPNNHLGFGGGGPHFCMGASLARTQTAAIFTQLMERVPRMEVGEPRFIVGNFIHGVASLPCTLNL